jgi:hypothetical protein
MKLQYTFTRQFFLRGLHPRTPSCPMTPQRGYPPSALPHVEECTYFWGVNTSWGINMVESKRPLNQEDNQAPQPIAFIYNQLDVNTYQQHIINKSSPQGTQRTQDVCTIFHFIMDFNPGVFQKQLNRVQLYKSTSSI